MSYARDRALSSEDRAAARDSAREEHKRAVDEQRAAMEAQENETPEFMDAGYEDTLPGQVEVVAGTVEHEKVLNTYHNATSYGPDVNVVVPAPEEEPPPDPPPEDPAAQQADPRVEPQWQREEEEDGR